MPSSEARIAVALVVVASVAVAAAAPAAGATGGPPSDGAGAFASQVDADDVLMRADLRADGDAAWTVTFRVRLTDDDETEAFRTLQRDVESNPENFTRRFGDRMRATAADAENATGREMAVRNVTVDTRVQEFAVTYGELTYTFEWTNFAAVEGDTLRAGDALRGLFLDEKTTLVIGWPEGYDLQEVSPAGDEEVGDEHSVGWAGPEEFGPEQPRVVVSKAGGVDDLSTGVLAVGVVAVLAAAGAFAWHRRRTAPAGSDEGSPAGEDGPAADGADSGDTDRATDAGQSREPPEELLSNEERVMRLVRERGGRIKQQEIVEEFGWTEAKTSQVVRDLREEGKLDGFRLGRENVLRLPDEDERL